ncbi:MAG: glycosyltransferase [Proteobacteria bacterium]|nr:glycosyltransferase [Pseudomonadota bacterium]MBS0513300.1 glycosyltransferase [Pseudomonadota bacterium]
MPHSHLKVLFFAEGATLAHAARPFVLARSLDAARFEVVFARPATYAWLTADAPFRTVDLRCQSSAIFTRRLEHGLPLYDYATLEKYAADDLALIDAEAPDVIIGDFRLSLTVSARLRNVPYITVCDAYWSPEYPLRPPLPVLSFTRFIPIPVAALLFQCVSPLAMRLHTLPIERLRARHGLPPLEHDLRRCYTDADLRLFANFPMLFPEVTLNDQAAFIGPLSWSPTPTAPLDLPQGEKRLVYVTMGSSGKTEVLTNIASVLEQLDCDVVVSTAGKKLSCDLRSHRTRVFDYVPGDLVCQRAALVVCNGGSPTTSQALLHGVPVLGIPWNMDQFLNMAAIERFGAGRLVRGDRASTQELKRAVELLFDAGYAARSKVLMKSTDPHAIGQTIETSISQCLSSH